MDNGLGPAWVAAIVNEIGQSKCATGNWNDTAIIITWDDWGGWFDHVKPPTLPCTSTSNCQGDYQYGFRVPMIVVSAYTLQSYVNNSTHDFGSILRMIEGMFSLGQGKLGFADARATTDLREFFTLTVPRPFVPIPSIKDVKFFLEQTGQPAAPDND
jgi:phospholipase C